MAENNLELVEIIGKQAYTNSLIIAECTEIQHKNVLELIRKYEDKLNRWGKIRFRRLKRENPLGGRPTDIALLNEQQATFLVTLFRNNDIVLNFKAELVDQFFKMREILQRQQNAEWIEIREAVKKDFRKLTDAIRDYIIPLARKLGSKTPDSRFYMSWATMICRIGCYKPGTRNRLSITQLFVLDQMQDIAVAAIKKLAPEGVHYKEIFQLAQIGLDDYARIAMVADRFAYLN